MIVFAGDRFLVLAFIENVFESASTNFELSWNSPFEVWNDRPKQRRRCAWRSGFWEATDCLPLWLQTIHRPLLGNRLDWKQSVGD